MGQVANYPDLHFAQNDIVRRGNGIPPFLPCTLTPAGDKGRGVFVHGPLETVRLGRKGTGTFFGLPAFTRRKAETGRKMSRSPAACERLRMRVRPLPRVFLPVRRPASRSMTEHKPWWHSRQPSTVLAESRHSTRLRGGTQSSKARTVVSEWLAGPRRVLRVFPSISPSFVLPPGPGGPLWQVDQLVVERRQRGFSRYRWQEYLNGVAPHPVLTPGTAVLVRWGERASRAGKTRRSGDLFGAKSLVAQLCQLCQGSDRLAGLFETAEFSHQVFGRK